MYKHNISNYDFFLVEPAAPCCLHYNEKFQSFFMFYLF